MIELAKTTLFTGDYSVVVVREEVVLAARNGAGVRPLLALYRESPELLLGSTIADKIIGKAAATILALSGVKEVYAQILSKAAILMLESNGINYSYGELVPFIMNRSEDGMCPLEESVLLQDEKHAAFQALTERIAELMNQTTKKS